jgi:hypothetical protein
MIGATGCEKKSGEAVVLAKEHIDAALPTAETPNAKSAGTPDEQLRPMADDEIAVDGYVMNPEVRGTSRDPRASKDKQRLVKSANARQRPHIPSSGRSSKMGEIARERPGQSQISHRQVHRNRLGC